MNCFNLLPTVQHPNIDSSQQRRGGKAGRGAGRAVARGRGQNQPGQVRGQSPGITYIQQGQGRGIGGNIQRNFQAGTKQGPRG